MVFVLYPIDGDSLLYRAANAIPHATNGAGLPTNALHGFATMLSPMMLTGRLTHGAVAFTADPPLRKHTLDPNYKINHNEHPEEIKPQIPYATLSSWPYAYPVPVPLIARLLTAIREQTYESLLPAGSIRLLDHVPRGVSGQHRVRVASRSLRASSPSSGSSQPLPLCSPFMSNTPPTLAGQFLLD